MPRRVRVPATDDLFRPTAVPAPEGPADPGPAGAGGAAVAGSAVVELSPTQQGQPGGRQRTQPGSQPTARSRSRGDRFASGRVRHDEKMTVYVTSEELLEIEHARLELRRLHGVAVDRGRLVRAAVAMSLADLDAHGADSGLVRRLHED